MDFNLTCQISETDATAELRVTNLRHADIEQLRKIIYIIEQLISVETSSKDTSHAPD